MTKEIQYRAISNDIEIRKDTDNNMVLEGYFILFDEETELFDGYFEKVDRKALEKTLDRDIKALFDHDPAKVLGRTKNDTLELRVDEKGLYAKIHINKDDTEATNLYQRVKRGDIDQCSFGFFIDDEDITQRDDGSYLSNIRELTLYEVSIVTFPAYANTSVTARSKEFENTKKRKHEIWKKKILERIK